MFQLTGKSIIGFARGTSHARRFHGVDPSNGKQLVPAYYSASSDEVDRAAQLAAKAFEIYGQATSKDKAVFLHKIAGNIEALGDELIERATTETALPTARIRNEIARTSNQLRLFAGMVEEGSWVEARIDRAEPARTPLPKPDVRSMLRPLGPVVVFCASNFPLAFSVAGGDTASALAAGNPVIVKAHHAHPGTAELVGLALSDAVRSCGLPEGVFSLIYGPGSEVGVQLVKHPLIKAGGFTGSRAGGLALLKLAEARPEPIPFYAEMSSVNHVFVLPSPLAERTDEIAKGLHGSVTLGAGQFCTNPGLVFIPDQGSDQLIKSLGELMAATSSFTMLTEGISSAYREGAAAVQQNSRVTSTAQPDAKDGCSAGAALFLTDAESFLEDASLSAEFFGPSTLLIKYSSHYDLLKMARSLEGQLTATIHASDEELKSHGDLIAILETKAGRLVFNGFPTGVEVAQAMVHGGPFPATSDGRSTSVGTQAVLRFVRPVCYQDFADSALPEELKDANPLSIRRMVDGEITKASVRDKLQFVDVGVTRMKN
jgi:alpha-ketoglutaric semialdehyde dehydrogenase